MTPDQLRLLEALCGEKFPANLLPMEREDIGDALGRIAKLEARLARRPREDEREDIALVKRLGDTRYWTCESCGYEFTTGPKDPAP
jgi:RNA polymerase-binding transcription factor DksA